jgi:protein O-mannosyl-transferase
MTALSVTRGSRPVAAARSRLRRDLVIGAALVLAVLASFAPVLRNEFIYYDDDPNLVQNLHIQQGVTLESVRWAFTTLYSQNWHPLTWLSHTVDFSLFGRWAGGHHAVSALIHAANAALLFALLRAMTGAFWRSALVAALFGLHPLRVESVAWAAERKDVLNLFFGLLALGAYLRYVRRRSTESYLAALGFFACALMSKSMLVTFPAILLLLDLWPLDRWSRARGVPFLPGRRLLLEKAPFLAFSAAASWITFFAQSSGGAVSYFIPLRQRIENAFCSYGGYLAKTVWPAKLSFFYPYFWGEVPWWKPPALAAFVAAATIVALLSLRRRPAWFFGWAWYVGTLVPVIGIVQVGSQSMADRYTYVPQIGVLLLIVWGLTDATEGRPRARTALLAAAPLVLAALAAATWAQAGLWRTSVTLFTHAIRVTENNYIAYSNLGRALVNEGRWAEGNDYISRSFSAAPAFRADLFESTGDYYAGIGRKREAAEQYRKALALAPKRHVQKKLSDLGDLANAPASAPLPDPHQGMALSGDFARGNQLVNAGRREEAAAAYREAIRADPKNAEAWNNLGCVLGELGRMPEAAAALEEALRLKPDHPTARKNLELIPGRGGR